MTRRPFLGFTLATCLAATSFTVLADDWPSKKAITMIVPFSAGGNTDATARLLADRLGKEIGQQIVVDNRPGAGSNIGSALASKAPPDGYTVLFATSTIAANVSLYKSTGFDLRKDLVPVSQVALIPNVLTVNNTLPAKTLAEFVALVKEKKMPISYGSAGSGSTSHLSGALFNSMAGGDMLHVPYKGGAPANTDLMGGQIQAVFTPLSEVLPYIEGGKLRALGVTTKDRTQRLPDVPAIMEVLPGFEVALWNGVFVPAATPDDVVERLGAAIQKVTKDASFRKILADQGSTPVGNTPAEFKQLVEQEIDNLGKLVKLSGASID